MLLDGPFYTCGKPVPVSDQPGPISVQPVPLSVKPVPLSVKSVPLYSSNQCSQIQTVNAWRLTHHKSACMNGSFLVRLFQYIFQFSFIIQE